MSKLVNHRLGYITNLSVSHTPDYVDVTSFRSISPVHIQIPSYVDVDMSICIPMENFSYFDYNSLMFPLSGASIIEEWRCLYCGRTNHVSRNDCSSCGGVRSFVLG